MNFREYLISQKTVLLSAVAALMWPNNNDSAAYLSRKLSGKLKFTIKDEERARQALKQLGVKLIADSKLYKRK